MSDCTNEIECCPPSPFSSAGGGGDVVPPTSYENTEQCYTASCPQGQTGADYTACIAAGTVTSTISQADANATALAQAAAAANAGLSCEGVADCVTFMPVMSSGGTGGYSVTQNLTAERTGYEPWRAFDGTGSWVPYPNATPQSLFNTFPYVQTIQAIRITVGSALNGVACKLFVYGFADVGGGTPSPVVTDVILYNYSFTGDSTTGTLIVLPSTYDMMALQILCYKAASPYTVDVKYIELFNCDPTPT